MASRVKAEKSSKKMADLSTTAKQISTLTGTVVATAENCRDKISTACKSDYNESKEVVEELERRDEGGTGRTRKEREKRSFIFEVLGKYGSISVLFHIYLI